MGTFAAWGFLPHPLEIVSLSLDLDEDYYRAHWILRQAGYTENDVPGMLRLARALNLRPIYTNALTRSKAGALDDVLAVDEHSSPALLNFNLAHETVERYFGHSYDPYVERAMNRSALILTAPTLPLRRAHTLYGLDFDRIGEGFVLPPTLAAIRLAHWQKRPIAVVSPQWTHGYFGGEQWPKDQIDGWLRDRFAPRRVIIELAPPLRRTIILAG